MKHSFGMKQKRILSVLNSVLVKGRGCFRRSVFLAEKLLSARGSTVPLEHPDPQGSGKRELRPEYLAKASAVRIDENH